MAGARDVTRDQKRIRDEQRRRNQLAVQEAEERRTAMEAEIEQAGLRPSSRRRRADRAEGVHHIKAQEPGSQEDKRMPPHGNKGDVHIIFVNEEARALAEEALERYGVGSPEHDALVEDLLAIEGKVTLQQVVALTSEEVTGDGSGKTLPDAPDLSAIAFGSPEAEKLALESGLSADDFNGLAPSGKTGYTKADVELVVESLQED